MSENIFDREVEAASEEIQSIGGFEIPEGIDSESAEQLRQIEALAQMDASFANSKEYQDLMSALSEIEQEEEDDYDEEYDEESDEDEESDVDEDIFGITKPQKKEKEINLNFEPSKEMLKFLNSNYGIKDAEKFFSSVNTWRNQAQEGSEVRKEFEALSADLQAMPPEIKMAVQLWANGDDHMAAFEMSQRLDFTDDFSSQNPVNLVQHYLPEEFDELMDAYDNEDIDDEEFEDRIILLSKSTKRLFSDDKKALENEREQFVQRQKNEHQLMRKSALLSVENLSKAYPNFSKSEISKIRNILVEGKVDNLFTNNDGSYNDDAAELVAYAMYGKKMLESVKKIAERQGESRANMKTVDSSPKTVRKQRSSGSTGAVNLEAVGHLSGVFKGDPYA